MKMNSAFFLLFLLVILGCNKDEISTTTDESLGNSGFSASFDAAGAGPSGSSGGQAGDSTLQAGLLTAGEWNDLDNWAFWEGLIKKGDYKDMEDYWHFSPFDRVSLKAKGPGGQPLVDAQATLWSELGEILWKTRTDNFGRAEFFPGLFFPGSLAGAKIIVEYDGQSFQLNQIKRYHEGVNELLAPILATPTQHADVIFVFDATGSMGDELEYVKTEINDIISRIQQENPSMNFNLGAVFYRDTGDEYLTRAIDLQSDFGQIESFINQQQAGGGGDFPEAVREALENAIGQQPWADNARARLLFLILDAPPHYDDATIAAVQDQIRAAAEKGIKIIPVTASGIDKETEFLMRFMAIATNGTYTFITDHSGIGNDHLEPTVGDYEVEYLNDLIVRLIGKYVE